MNRDGLKMAIVAHDAGAANHIIHWYLSGDLDGYILNLFLYGPAKIIADNLGVPCKDEGFCEGIDQCDVLLSGTGWATDIERKAVHYAIKQNKTVYSVFDHWENYQTRLLFRGEMLKPTQIWVTDRYAREMVDNFFVDIACIIKKNRYLDYISRGVSLSDKQPGITIVTFVMEPIRDRWPEINGIGEFVSFDYFMRLSGTLTEDFLQIAIRPHPSDPKGKYAHLERSSEAFSITVESDIPLEEQLSGSDLVVGIQSYALVIALAAGKKVMSAIPEYAPTCSLPHEGIIHLKELSHEIL